MKTKLSAEAFRQKWGIPDWRDASAYPTKRISWKWEFLRRREDYRQDYQRAYTATVRWYREHSFEDYDKNRINPTGGNGICLWNWDGPQGPNFCVEMSGSIKKYATNRAEFDWLLHTASLASASGSEGRGSASASGLVPKYSAENGSLLKAC